MKKFFTSMAAVMVSAVFLTSCLDDSVPDYPSAQQLNGVFGHTDVAGYTALMMINYPSAYFVSFTPLKAVDCEVEGKFSYEQESGSGTLVGSSEDSPKVSVETFRGVPDLFDAVAHRETATDTTIYLKGGFTRLYPIKFVVGTWTDTDITSPTIGSTLTITSLLAAKCGTLVVQKSLTEADTADITGVSDFYMLSTSDAIGAFSYKRRDKTEEKMAFAFFDSQALTLSFISMDEELALDFDKFKPLQ